MTTPVTIPMSLSPRRIAMLAGVLAASAVFSAGAAHAQTRAQAPRPNAGKILSRSFTPPDNGVAPPQRHVQRAPLRGRVGATVGGRVILDREGRRIVPTRPDRRRDHDDHDHDRHDRDHHDRHDHDRHHHRHHGRILFPTLGYTYGGYYSTSSGRGYETPTVIVVENPPGAAVRTNEIDGPEYVEPVEPPTITEVAFAAMARGDYEDAITRWRERLAEAPEDASAVRALGLSMALDGDLQTGTAMVAHAYRMSPELVHERLDPWTLGGERELRRSLRRVVIYANSRKTESAWLTVAALMQAEDRDDHAARMVEKAREAGLEPELADRFTGALGAE